jgi:hypothetical protein
MLVPNKAESGTTATVRVFSPDMDAIETSIVNCAFRYDCTYTNKTYILVAHNALYVPTMDHNLIPPFILREAGLIVNETPMDAGFTPHLELLDAAALDDDNQSSLSR